MIVLLANKYTEAQGVLRKLRICGNNRKPTQEKISAKTPLHSWPEIFSQTHLA